VAALYIRGGQLLVISARHPSVEGLAYRIAKREYRDVYMDLHGTPAPEGKFFVQDARADGILSAVKDSGAVDIVHEDGVRQTMFNGDTAAQRLTRRDRHGISVRAPTAWSRARAPAS
jgi:hypothetical protein